MAHEGGARGEDVGRSAGYDGKLTYGSLGG